MFVGLENGFAMARSGMLEDEFWPRMCASTMEYLRPTRGRRWWSIARTKTFAPNVAFVAEIDAIIAKFEAAEQEVTE